MGSLALQFQETRQNGKSLSRGGSDGAEDWLKVVAYLRKKSDHKSLVLKSGTFWRQRKSKVTSHSLLGWGGPGVTPGE